MSSNVYDFYPAVLFAIDRLADGLPRSRACHEAGISVGAFLSCLDKDETLRDQAADAEQRGYDAMAEALLSPDNHAIYGHSEPAMAKIQSDNLKWFLKHKDPKRFGEKIQVDVSVTADRAITEALLAGRRRLEGLLPAAQEAIDVTPDMTDEELLRAEGFI